MSWRDYLAVHPAADIFPMLDDADLVALGEDIRCNGLTSPIAITIDQDDKPILLDGRNRLSAMERIGWRLKLVKSRRKDCWELSVEGHLDEEYPKGYSLETIQYRNAVEEIFDATPFDYIASVNIHRRHLTQESKRALIAQLLKENPERSDRATAELVNVDHKTVAAVRRHEEDVGSIPHVDTRVDTKGRSQQASKRKKVSASKAKTAAPSVPQDTQHDREMQMLRNIWEAAEPTARAEFLHEKLKEGFTPATSLLGELRRYAEFCRTNSPALVAAGVLPHERDKLIASIAVIDAWLSRFSVALDRASDVPAAPTAETTVQPMQNGAYPVMPEFLDRR